ncbi:MAG: hypothetical protein IT236_17705 [Bacteroidia bacterium]|nr:hypothetical protein [Bacteroidia bacterium]
MKKTRRISIKFLFIATAIVGMLTTLSFIPVAEPEGKTPVENCDSIPELNKKVLEFASSKINLKVGMGDAWDLASEALNAAGAKWDNDYKFGRKINPDKECILPGDIIEMRGTKIEYKEHDVFYREELKLHIAIIYSVAKQNHFVLIEQNTGKLGQKVGTSPLELKQLKTGKYKIFRPIK